MSDQACEILLYQTKYDVKPVLCVSDTSYGSNSENHHYGLGQVIDVPEQHGYSRVPK